MFTSPDEIGVSFKDENGAKSTRLTAAFIKTDSSKSPAGPRTIVAPSGRKQRLHFGTHVFLNVLL